jgi:hypothetical protein
VSAPIIHDWPKAASAYSVFFTKLRKIMTVFKWINSGFSRARLQAARKRFTLKQELIMAVLQTITVLCVFLLVGAFSRQRLLFASLSSSAFLIYVDPEHGMSRVFTHTFSQMMAASLGLFSYLIFGPGYLSGGRCMNHPKKE